MKRFEDLTQMQKKFIWLDIKSIRKTIDGTIEFLKAINAPELAEWFREYRGQLAVFWEEER